MTTTPNAGSATGFDLAALSTYDPDRDTPGMMELRDTYKDGDYYKVEDVQAALARATPQHPDLSSAEFLSIRLARVAKLAGVTMPDGDHVFIAGVAGTILGDIARHLEKAATPQQEPAPTLSEVQADEAKLYRDLTGDAMALGFDGVPAALEALRATPQHPRPTDDELWDATLRDRDTNAEWADKLAGAIAIHFGVNIGEHSNMNLPWAEALDAIESAPPPAAADAATPQHSVTEQDVCAEMRALCSACGGTGDVHSIDGEWRGSCDCQASTAAHLPNLASEQEIIDIAASIFGFKPQKQPEENKARYMRFAEAVQARYAVPQHSVAEHDKAVHDAAILVNGVWHVPIHLASTAATQPEQASGISLDAILNCYSPDDTVHDYQDKIRALFAALAIPASTAASEQPDEFAHIAALSKATTRQYEPIYQAWDARSGKWSNITKAHFDNAPKNARRIVNTPAASEQQAGADGNSAKQVQYWTARALLAERGLLDQKNQALTHRATTSTPGYKLVPLVPTKEMYDAARLAWCVTPSFDVEAIYKAMLAATPDIATTAAVIEVQPGHAFIAPPGYEVRHVEATTAADQQGDTASDAAIEAMFKDAGGRWDGNYWVIEDADLHPFIRAVRAQQGAAQAQAGDGEIYARYTANGLASDARDAARYRVLREHVSPAAVRIAMRLTPPPNQSIEERIDMLCDQLVDAAMAAPATSNGSKA